MCPQPVVGRASFAALALHDVMHPGIISCQPEDELATVAATMVTRGIHATMLSPLSSTRPLIVTDLELVRAVLERPRGTRAGELSSEPAPTLNGGASVHDAVAKMAELYVAHLIVTDAATAVPCGVISSFDIVALIGGYQPARARALHPEPPARAASIPSVSETTARAAMHPGVVTCGPDAPLWGVARSMVKHRVHCVAVAGVGDAGAHGHHFGWGLINDMELVLAAHSGGLSAAAATIASAAPPAVNEGDPLERAASLMVSDGARHVVVIGSSGLPSGMISTLDVLRIVAAST